MAATHRFLLITALAACTPDEVVDDPPVFDNPVLILAFDTWPEASANVLHTWTWKTAEQDAEQADFDAFTWTTTDAAPGFDITVGPWTPNTLPESDVAEEVRALRTTLRELAPTFSVSEDGEWMPPANLDDAWASAEAELTENSDALDILTRAEFTEFLSALWRPLMVPDLVDFSVTANLPKEMPDRLLPGYDQPTTRSLVWTGDRSICGGESCLRLDVIEELKIDDRPLLSVTYRITLEERTLRPHELIVSETTFVREEGNPNNVSTNSRRDVITFEWLP